MTINEFMARVEGCPMPRFYKHQVLQWLAELDLPERLIIEERYKAMELPTEHLPTDANLLQLWEQSAKHYDVAFDLHKKDRTKEFVAAKTHFARLVKMQYPKMPIRKLANFMGKDRSSVYHYWYYSGYNCDMPPIPQPKTK